MSAALEVVTLGTGSPLPDPNRAGPSTLVRAGGATLIVDAGRGVLMRMAAAATGAPQLGAVLVTHLHSDHLTDLNDLITTRWVMSFGPPSPLRVAGPPGIRGVVDGLLASLAPDVSYRLAHHADLTSPPAVEVIEHSDGPVLELDDVSVTAAPTDHRPAAPSVAYRIERDGHAVVIAGDTIPCEGLDRLCAGADVLVHTVVRDDLIRSLPVARLHDVCDYHSTVAQAAQTAARAGVETLVLTHCVPAVAPGAEEEWLALARAEFPGEVVLAADLSSVPAG